MRKFVLLFFVVLVVGFLHAQNKNADKIDYKTNNVERKSTIFSEDFEIWPLDGWEIVSGAESEASGDELWHDGGGVAEITYVDGSMCDEWLISPAISIPEGYVYLKWDWMASYYWMVDPNDGADLMVKISTDGGATWSDYVWIEDNETLVTNSGVEWPWANYTFYTSVIDLSEYTGQDINLAWHYYDFDGAQTQIDNVEVFDLEPVDIVLSEITIPANAQPGEIPITGKVVNNGSNNITSYDVTYNIDGGNESSVFNVTGVDIAYGEDHLFAHPDEWSFNADGTYTVTVTVSNVNNSNEETNLDNNVLSKEISIVSNTIQRTVLLEQFTTESCPNCPPVLTALEGHMDVNPNFIMMAHHSGFYTDFLTIPASEAHLEFFNAGGATYAPAGMVDRHYNGEDNDNYGGVDPGPVFWDGNPYGPNRIDERTEEPAFVSIEIAGENNSGELSLTVSGEFLKNFSQELGVSLWITEDNIPAQNQAGATDWIHRYAVRDVISERLGDPIESSTVGGETFTKTYTYTYSSEWNADELYLVATVNDMSNNVNEREIQNACQVKVSDLDGSLSYYTVTFNATDGSDPLEGVNIDIDGSELITDTNGEATIDLPNGTYQFNASLTDYEAYTDEVVINGADETVVIELDAVGIGNINGFDFKVYPNPSAGLLYVTANGNCKVNIINVVGKVVKSLTFDNETTIDMSGNASGVYFIQVEADGKLYNQRIILE